MVVRRVHDSSLASSSPITNPRSFLFVIRLIYHAAEAVYFRVKQEAPSRLFVVGRGPENFENSEL